MAYDNDFYRAYDAYLKETTVRKQHDWVFQVARLNPNFKRVVDLGCGQFNEYFHYARPQAYAGIDLNVESNKRGRRKLVQGDYRSIAVVKEAAELVQATAFVSLFSTEITAPCEDNYKLYEQLFQQVPGLKVALVAGFYYRGREYLEKIEETGGVVSYQTLEDPYDVFTPDFSEKRIEMPVPSGMFGYDVYEVWKIFEKSENLLSV